MRGCWRRDLEVQPARPRPTARRLAPAPQPPPAPRRRLHPPAPAEASLAELDPLVAQLRRKVARVDGEILAAVRAQSASGGRARSDLAASKATIEDLFGKIREIQRKAEQSELMVQVGAGRMAGAPAWLDARRGQATCACCTPSARPPARLPRHLQAPLTRWPAPTSPQEICRDIKKLDYAKSHLTATITALRRLSMLVSAVGACGWPWACPQCCAGLTAAGMGGMGVLVTAWQGLQDMQPLVCTAASLLLLLLPPLHASTHPALRRARSQHVRAPQTSCSWRWSGTSTARRRTCWRRCSSCPRTSSRTCTSPRWRSSRWVLRAGGRHEPAAESGWGRRRVGHEGASAALLHAAAPSTPRPQRLAPLACPPPLPARAPCRAA